MPGTQSRLRVGPGGVTRARRAAGLHGTGWALRSTLAGRAYSGLRARRRLPQKMIAVRRQAARHGTPLHARGQGGDTYPTLVVLPAGPGHLEVLLDAIDSVRHYMPEAKVVAIDDHTMDCHAPAVQRVVPEADVIRTRIPCCTALRQYTQQGHVLTRLLRTYRFELLIKMDIDALVVGHGVTDLARAAFAADPRLGMLGTYGTDADGTPSDTSYERWYLTHEVRWSRGVRRLVRGAEAAGFDPALHVQGGAYVVARRALDALDRSGALRWRQPWWSQIFEDNLMSLQVLNHGFTIGPWGGPGEPVASLPTRLPIALEEIAGGATRLAHSVRLGSDGESEDEVRAFFRERRAADTPTGDSG